ncbi:hypothetical protein FA15DRAFT_674756 [Coprinopsis marcescibilis]|uniref:Uncharacterized protein n=1 Tax=Coprinopsis marcescibilis TaxID=230819 RepID=A0A5C3KGV9_COPMA|nr:hypothetical protein FA15DRAFT_674756 [Coprinopsis marcescibilis]
MASTLSQEVFLLYDNTSPNFDFFRVEQDQLELGYAPAGRRGGLFWHNNTVLLSRNSSQIDDALPFRQVSFEFQGPSVTFFGFLSNRFTQERPFTDDSLPSATWFLGDSRQGTNITGPLTDAAFIPSGQFFASPLLSDDYHNIILQMDDPAGAVMLLDFAVVEGGSLDRYDASTSIIVDNDAPSEIFYWGDWKLDEVGLEALNRAISLPYRNNTHRTSTIGSGFRFRFAGTSLRIYGSHNQERAGSYNVTFTLDDEAPRTLNYTVTREEINNFPVPELLREYPHYLLAEFESLEAKEHVITANLTHIEGASQGLLFDYLVYTPTFRDRASKPQFNVSELNPDLDITATTNTPGSTADNSRGSGVNLPVIIGTTIGVVVFLLLIVGGFLTWKWRRKSNRHKTSTLKPAPVNINSVEASDSAILVSPIEPYQAPFGLSERPSWSQNKGGFQNNVQPTQGGSAYIPSARASSHASSPPPYQEHSYSRRASDSVGNARSKNSKS